MKTTDDSAIPTQNVKKNAKAAKSKLVIWLEFIPFLFLYAIIRILPYKAGYAISGFLFKILYHLDTKHRQRAVRHILYAGITTEDKEAERIAKRSFGSFAKLLVEIVKRDQIITPDKVKLSGSATTIRDTCLSAGKKPNVIIVTGHYGNWELAGHAWAHKSGVPMVSIMRPFNNPLIGKYIIRSRESEIHKCVSKEGGIKEMLRALKQGKTIAILADQHASKGEGVETIFFGHPARTHSSPALLHLKTGIPIMTALTRRLDDNLNFEFILGDLIRYTPTGDKGKDVKTVTQMYTAALENTIRDYPEQWLWSHRRWMNIHRPNNACVISDTIITDRGNAGPSGISK